MIGFLAFVLPLGFYLSLPSCLWNFDGVACAIALEVGNPTFYFHSNHLIFAFMGNLFWKEIALPMGMTRALPALQLFVSILSAIGILGLYKLLSEIVEDNFLSILLSTAMSLTAAFWVWSLEAQVYPLGFAALAWAAFLIVRPGTTRKYMGVGILHGLAVLGHVMHGVWLVPALYWLIDETRDQPATRTQALKYYFASLAAMVGIPYLIVLLFVIMPGHHSAWVEFWLKGSAALRPDRHWQWHSSGMKGPWIWLKSTIPAFWGSFWPYAHPTNLGMWCVTWLSIAIAAYAIWKSLGRRSQRIDRMAWIWIVTYGIFLSTWEPATLCYRMTDILPWGILLALGLRELLPWVRAFLAALFLASTFLVNFESRILPMHDSQKNLLYEDTLRLSRITPANSLYITENGGLPWIYILYFTGRTAWNAKSFDSQSLAWAIAREKTRRPVYVQQGTQWRKI